MKISGITIRSTAARLTIASGTALAVGATLFLGSAPTALALPSPKPGAVCTILGQVVRAGTGSLICGKLTGKQVWQRVLVATTVGSVNGQWVKWNPITCTFDGATGPRNQRYTAYMRTVPSSISLALGTQGEGVAIQDALNGGFKQAVQQVGAELVFANYRQSEFGAAGILEGARNIALKRPSAVSSWAGLTTVLPAMMNVYRAVCTPVVQITFPIEGTVSYGADNSTVGRMQGKFLAEYLKEKKLNTGPVTVVAIRAPSIGVDVNKRVDVCALEVQKLLPQTKISNAEVDASQLSVAGAQIKMTDWLTANPASAAGTVVICTIADIYAIGAGNAVKSSGRVGNVFASGVAGSTDALALIRAGDPVFVGTVDFRFQDWGKVIVPLMLDALEGKIVPRLSAPNVSMITARNLP